MAKVKEKSPPKPPPPPVQVQPSVFASVAFFKIHDFGRRPVVEQTRLRAQLEAVVAVALQDLAEDGRILLDAADGIALVVLDDPRGALALAQRSLAAGAVGLPLAIGINHGPVKQAGKGKNEGLMGDGISVAAAVAELAGAQKLLMTRDFRLALEDAAPGAEAALAAAGTHTDASARAHDVFRPDPRGEIRRSRGFAAATIFVVIALVGAGIGWRTWVEGPKPYADRVKAQAMEAWMRLRGEAPPAPAWSPPARKKGR
jgi:hypothetical protein